MNIIKKFLSNDKKVTQYRQGLLLLQQSGFIDLLRQLGVPVEVHGGSDVQAMAHQGSMSVGFQNAINHLEYFEQYYDKPAPEKAVINPTFGGAELALNEKYLTEEELQKIKGGNNDN